ncbi:MAG TPA: SDR family oxidoreductase [Patescibacteria group bacterium]|nr:SDR family oxidoreductase [Patescibacteria group bacterium]
MLNLRDMKVVITGAASGLGAALARGFAARGCQLALSALQPVPLEQLTRELASVTGLVRSMSGDFRDLTVVKRFADFILREFTHVDILINNAAMIVPGRIGHSDFANWQDVLQVNLTAPCLLVNDLAAAMNERSASPLVVNIASVAALQGAPYEASYVVAKSGLLGLTAAINEEFRMYGRLRAMTLCPGNMDTAIWPSTEGWPGISRTPRDRLMDPITVTQSLIRMIEVSDEIDITQMVLTPRKDINGSEPLENPIFSKKEIGK